MIPPQNLTPREKDVLALLKKGKTDKEISVELNITIRAAQYHVGRLRRKFQFRDRRAFMLEGKKSST